ncbi:MAG: D-tagatose-bisphosphate aldolase, class II, non-catalytic subunit [Sinobacteraceae bacterium]|nr:D-tagatose-bisphosphate aldolase, class II, non-catalytic subunit [Nevskiaceae bacterium]
MKALLGILSAHRAGHGGGICSVCSSHPLAIEAALRTAAGAGQHALIEVTSNQVNQFGGYSGMRPSDFRQYLHTIVSRVGFPQERVLLGGDHLGPNCWRSERAQLALERSRQLVADYVTAGFRKIHLDCSMSCADDPRALDDEVIASRAAQLCRASEEAWRQCGGEAPVYVIGTEVPTPGGATEELGTLAVTTPAAVSATLRAHREAFERQGLADAWERVIALVVQPGVEFDHHKVIDYAPAAARELSQRIEQEPRLVFEAHSTDYQTAAALGALVRDHFAILKVGPAVTFALREALWALAAIETELGIAPATSLKEVVLNAMRRDPQHWAAYYSDPATQLLDLQYSLSDRIRYYWTVPEVQQACEGLLENLRTQRIPLTLLSQYLPLQYAAVRAGRLDNDPHELLIEGVAQVLRGYAAACAGYNGHEDGVQDN